MPWEIRHGRKTVAVNMAVENPPTVTRGSVRRRKRTASTEPGCEKFVGINVKERMIRRGPQNNIWLQTHAAPLRKENGIVADDVSLGVHAFQSYEYIRFLRCLKFAEFIHAWQHPRFRIHHARVKFCEP